MRGPPQFRGPAGAALYMPLAATEDFADLKAEYDFAGVVLKKGFRYEEFKQHWSERLAAASPPAYLQSLAEIDGELNESTTSETVCRGGTIFRCPAGTPHMDPVAFKRRRADLRRREC